MSVEQTTSTYPFDLGTDKYMQFRCGTLPLKQTSLTVGSGEAAAGRYRSGVERTVRLVMLEGSSA